MNFSWRIEYFLMNSLNLSIIKILIKNIIFKVWMLNRMLKTNIIFSNFKCPSPIFFLNNFCNEFFVNEDIILHLELLLIILFYYLPELWNILLNKIKRNISHKWLNLLPCYLELGLGIWINSQLMTFNLQSNLLQSLNESINRSIINIIH